MKSVLSLCAVLILSTACSRSNNLAMGRVEATVGTHTVVVTDCYRTSVAPPEKLPDVGYRFTPCRDADVLIRRDVLGDVLIVNGKTYGPLGSRAPVLVDHGVVSFGN